LRRRRFRLELPFAIARFDGLCAEALAINTATSALTPAFTIRAFRISDPPVA
jgi:hypothetical protein